MIKDPQTPKITEIIWVMPVTLLRIPENSSSIPGQPQGPLQFLPGIPSMDLSIYRILETSLRTLEAPERSP